MVYDISILAYNLWPAIKNKSCCCCCCRAKLLYNTDTPSHFPTVTSHTRILSFFSFYSHSKKKKKCGCSFQFGPPSFHVVEEVIGVCVCVPRRHYLPSTDIPLIYIYTSRVIIYQSPAVICRNLSKISASRYLPIYYIIIVVVFVVIFESTPNVQLKLLQHNSSHSIKRKGKLQMTKKKKGDLSISLTARMLRLRPICLLLDDTHVASSVNVPQQRRCITANNQHGRQRAAKITTNQKGLKTEDIIFLFNIYKKKYIMYMVYIYKVI